MAENENQNQNEAAEARQARLRSPNARRECLEPSSPSIRSIARVVVITLLIVFVGNRIETIVGALTFLTFFVVVSIFLAYLIDPLVRLIRRPFEETSYDRYMPRSLAIALTYILV